MLDRSEPLQDDDHLLIKRPVTSLLVASKADLPAAWGPSDRALAGSEIEIVSAEAGKGLDRLIAAIAAALVPIPPEPGTGIPFRLAQLEQLRRARDALPCERSGRGYDGDRHGKGMPRLKPTSRAAGRTEGLPGPVLGRRSGFGGRRGGDQGEIGAAVAGGTLGVELQIILGQGPGRAPGATSCGT